MMTEDEFVRPPWWLLVFWNPNGKIELSVLLDPLEANISFQELKLSTSKLASLHRFTPRNRRDQKELLTSGLEHNLLACILFLYSIFGSFGSSFSFFKRKGKSLLI